MKVIVLGGGVIGTTTAYYLAKQGHEVHLVDRQDGVALETSFANGGVLHTSEAEPWSRPGMPTNIWKWLGKEDAPMLLRYGALPGMWRWGLAFLRNCTLERYRRSTTINLRLSFYTLKCIAEIREEAAIDYDLMQKGTLKIYTRREALEQNRTECETMRPHGMVFEVVDAKRCVAIEPALAPIEHTLVGGLFFPPDEHGDCHKFTTGLRQHCEQKLGVRCHFGTEVKALRKAGDRLEFVETSKGPMSADCYVAAMGSYTPLHLRPLGVAPRHLSGQGRHGDRAGCALAGRPQGADHRRHATVRPDPARRPLSLLGLGRVHRLRRHAEPRALSGHREQRHAACSPSSQNATTRALRNSGPGSGRWRRPATPISARRRSATCSSTPGTAISAGPCPAARAGSSPISSPAASPKSTRPASPWTRAAEVSQREVT